MFGVNGNATLYRARPLEWFINRKFKELVDRSSPTRYGDKNAKEWFAENFSLYFMNKRDLVDPRAKEIIEKVMENDLAYFGITEPKAMAA